MTNFLAKICCAGALGLVLASTATPSAAMNRQELIEAMARDSNISKTEAARALDSLVNRTTAALKKGDRVAIVGFGSFSTAKREARTGRNPQTGAVIKIPARTIVRFRASKALGDAVNR